jgi:membrane protease YdiL (CAAX protease family)
MLGILIAERLLGAVRTTHAGLDPPRLLSLAATLVVSAAGEEFIFRSLLLSGLLIVFRDRAWAAVLLTGVLFGLLHASNMHASYLSVVGNGLGGLIYALAFVRTRRIWATLALHFAWNYVQGPIIGFPVSGYHFDGLQQVIDLGPVWVTGGAYGPEAGVVGIAARFVIIAAVMAWTAAPYKDDGAS